MVGCLRKAAGQRSRQIQETLFLQSFWIFLHFLESPQAAVGDSLLSLAIPASQSAADAGVGVQLGVHAQGPSARIGEHRCRACASVEEIPSILVATPTVMMTCAFPLGQRVSGGPVGIDAS